MLSDLSGFSNTSVRIVPLLSTSPQLRSILAIAASWHIHKDLDFLGMKDKDRKRRNPQSERKYQEKKGVRSNIHTPHGQSIQVMVLYTGGSLRFFEAGHLRSGCQYSSGEDPLLGCSYLTTYIHVEEKAS